jgi:hypothetical protein
MYDVALSGIVIALLACGITKQWIIAIASRFKYFL